MGKMSSDDSTLVKIMNYVKAKVPVTLLTINMMINKYTYSDCNVDIKVFWGYYLTLNILCLVWEGFFNYNTYKKIYNHNDKNTWIYTSISTLSGLLLFNTYNYFLAKPFDCYFNYSHEISSVIFFISIALVATV